MTAENIPAWMVGRPKPIGLPAGEDPNRKLTQIEKYLAGAAAAHAPGKAAAPYLEDGKFPLPETLEQLLALNEWLDEQNIQHPPMYLKTRPARNAGY